MTFCLNPAPVEVLLDMHTVYFSLYKNITLKETLYLNVILINGFWFIKNIDFITEVNLIRHIIEQIYRVIFSIQ